MQQQELFGSDDQRALLRRGMAMARLIGNDPRYTYYGRTVGLVSFDDGTLDDLIALTRLQGNSNCGVVANDDIADLAAQLKDHGLSPVQYAKWVGENTALTAARQLVRTVALPQDVTLITLDEHTRPETIGSLADMALGCGVLPSCGAVLRGLGKPAVCVAAVDQAGTVVSCAATAAFAHGDHPLLGRQAWWGMLATAPTRRGERLALILGAHAIVTMHEKYGFSSFMTGVEPGNAPSEAVCARIGFLNTDVSVLGCADPALLGSGRMTK